LAAFPVSFSAAYISAQAAGEMRVVGKCIIYLPTYEILTGLFSQWNGRHGHLGCCFGHPCAHFTVLAAISTFSHLANACLLSQ
jgi:hypothetical protein